MGVVHGKAPATIYASRPPAGPDILPSCSGPLSEAEMYHIDDPADMTTEERLEEVAAILAAGYLRLKARRRHLADPPESLKSPEKDLEVCPDVSPHDT